MKARYVVRITPADVGRRVSVRSRLPADGPQGPNATDTLGHLRSWVDGVLEIETRDGSVRRVAEVDLLAGRLVPPAPARRRAAPDTHPVEQQRLALQESAHPDCDPLRVQAVIWLFRAYSAAVGAQAEELRPLGLSPSGFNVLMALHNTPGHTLEPCQLAERLLVSRPSVSGLLDTLQAKGLVHRAPHPQDRRRVHVVLTAAADDLLAAHFSEHYQRQRELLADLSPDELASLVGLLRRVRGATPAHLLPAHLLPGV